MGECPLCGESTNKSTTRLIKDSCGHSKCRLCLLNEESGCSVCEGNNGDIPCTIESIGNFDYRLPGVTTPNFEELNSTPCKLDFNKIPDDFTDCPLSEESLSIDNSIKPSSESIVANISTPKKVDIGTETDNTIAQEKVQLQPTQQNTHSSLSQVEQSSVQPTTKSSENYANTVKNNYVPNQETPVVQSTNFIPVNQRSDGRQFITIAFIANNSPNKTQHVVAPLINQCLPGLTNVAAVQRPGGNQCIPLIGNINALQSPMGNQFIIRNTNIVQSLAANQSVPIIGNLNTMQNLISNQCLPPQGNMNPQQSPIKSIHLSTSGSPNAVQKSVQNHPVQTTVPKTPEKQISPVQENVNAARKQIRTRGLPRIKNVKNVNIMQKSNQSDKVNSQTQKSLVQAVKSKRQPRKELPVYLVPKQTNEKIKNISTANPAHIVNFMSNEYKLEDYLLFNKESKANDTVTSDLEMQTEKTNDTQMINKPLESVINETPNVSDQSKCTEMQKAIAMNRVDEFEQENKVVNDETSNEKDLNNVSVESSDYKEHQDLSVVFNIRERNKQRSDEKINDEIENNQISNEESSNNEEYQNLDVLFDIIEKESQKLNGGIFNKDELKVKLSEVDSYEQEEYQNLNEKMGEEKDESQILYQKVGTEKEKTLDLNVEIHKENENNQCETYKEEIRNSQEICYEQKQNIIEETRIESVVSQHLIEGPDNEEEESQEFNLEINDEKEESKQLYEEIFHKTEYLNLNEVIPNNVTETECINEKIGGNDKIQYLNEKLGVNGKEKSEYLNSKLFNEKAENQIFNEENLNNEENIHKLSKENVHSDEITAVEGVINDKERKNLHLNEKFDRENQEIQNLCGKNYDQNGEYNHSSGNIETKENQISEKKVDNEDKISHQSLEMETCTEEDESSQETFDTNTLSLEKNIANNDKQTELEFPINDEQSIAAKKQRDESKIFNHDVSSECNLLLEKEQSSIARFSDLCREYNNVEDKDQGNIADESQLLGKEVDNHGKKNDSLSMEVHKNEHGFFKENNSNNKMLDTVHENEQSGATNEPGDTPKKLLPNDEYLGEHKLLGKNEQSVAIKQSRDSSRNSNHDMTSEGNDDQEKEQSTVMKFPDLSKEYNSEESKHHNYMGITDTEKSQLLEKETDKHVEKNKSLSLETHNKKADFSEGNNSNDQTQDTLLGNEQITVMKKPRGRPKKSMSNAEQLKEHGSPSVAVKKPKGRPKKSNHDISSIHNSAPEKEQPSITKLPNLCNIMFNIEEDKNQDNIETVDREESQLLEKGPDNHDEKNESLSMENQIKEDEFFKRHNFNDKTLDVLLANEQLTLMKKPRDRSKKSLSNDEQLGVQESLNKNEESSNLKKIRSRPEKSNHDILTEHHKAQEKEQPAPVTKFPNSCSEYKMEENEHTYNVGIIERKESELLDKESGNYDEKNDSKVDEVFEENHSNDKSLDDVHANQQLIVIKKPRGRPRKTLSHDEYPSEHELLNKSEQSVAVKKPRGRPKKLNYDILSKRNSPQKKEQPTVTKVPELTREYFNENNKHQDPIRIIDKEESQLLAQKANKHDEKNESLNMEKHNKEAAIFESNNSNDQTLDALLANEQITIMKKPRGRPKKSLSNDEKLSDHELLNENEQSIAVKNPKKSPKKINHDLSSECNSAQEKEHSPITTFINLGNNIEGDKDRDKVLIETIGTEKNKLLDKEVDNHVEKNKSLGKKTQNKDDEFIEGNNVNDKTLDALLANEQITIVKNPRGRSKKSLPNDEKLGEDESLNENEQSVAVKAPRSCPKISNHDVSNECNRALEKEQPAAVTKFPNLCSEHKMEENKYLHNVESIEREESQFLDKEADNRDEKNESLCTESHNDEDKPLEENNSNDKSLDNIHANVQLMVVKKPRGRPKKSLSNEEELSENHLIGKYEQSVKVKRPRGRPKKSNHDTSSEQSSGQVIELPAAMMKFPNLCSRYKIEENKHLRNVESIERVESQLLDKEADNHDETNESLWMESHNNEDESLEGNNSNDKSLDNIHANVQLMVVKKPRGRPKKSLSNDEELSGNHLIGKYEQAVKVKKPRGRPKKSSHDISSEQSSGQVIEQSAAMTKFSNLCSEYKMEENKHSHIVESIEREESQLLDKEADNHEGRNGSLCMEMHNKEGEVLEAHDSNDKNLDAVYVNDQLLFVKKPRGRPKKSLMNYKHQCESEVTNKDQEPIDREESKILNRESDSYYEKNDGLSRITYNREGTNCHANIEANVTFTQIENSNDQNSAGIFERKDEKIDREESTFLNKEFDNHDKNECLSLNTYEKGDSSHANVNAYVKFSQIETSNDKSSAGIFEHKQLEITKKSRGRPRKPLPNLIQLNDNGFSQNRELPAAIEFTNTRRENGQDENIVGVINRENTEFLNEKMDNRDDINQGSNIERHNKEDEVIERHNLNDLEKETHKHDEENKSLNMEMRNKEDELFEENNSNDKTLEALLANEQLTIMKKPRGRPKKSFTSCEQQSEPEVSQGIEQLVVIKEPNDEPKKSLPNHEQPSESGFFQNRKQPAATELSRSSGQINYEPGSDQYLDEQIEDKEIVKESNYSVKTTIDNEKNESINSDVNTNVNFIKKSILDYKKQDIIHENDHRISIKKLKGRRKISNVQTVIKKPRGRPKKVVFDYEQLNKSDISQVKEIPIVTELSNLSEENNHRVLERNVSNQTQRSQSSNLSIHNHDESLPSYVNVDNTFNQKDNINDNKLDGTCERELVIVKKPKGRPRKILLNIEHESASKELHKNKQSVVVKKPRGRPKKSNDVHEKCNLLPKKEQLTVFKLLNLCTEYNDKKYKNPYFDEEIQEKESKALDNKVQKYRTEIQKEENKILHSNTVNNGEEEQNHYKNVEIHKRQQENNQSLSEDMNNMMVVSNLSKESSEETLEQNCNDVPNQRESQILLKEIDGKEEESQIGSVKEIDDCREDNQILQAVITEENVDSKSLKLQDDENKENKEKYSEKEDTVIETTSSITEESNSEKPTEINDEVIQNNSTVRKYRSFDKINTQVIVENSKRKRKPKVLLYENEDLDIPTVKKKKKDIITLSHENESTVTIEKSQKSEMQNSRHTDKNTLDKKSCDKNVQKRVKENLNNLSHNNENVENVEEFEENGKNVSSFVLVAESSVETGTNGSRTSTVMPLCRDEEKCDKNTKRNRRPKTLLYENEDLTITPKNTKKKKVEFLLSTNKDLIISNNIEKCQNDNKVINLTTNEQEKEGNTLNIITQGSEGLTITKKSERNSKPKTLLCENESLKFTPVKGKVSKPHLNAEDLIIIKKFEIKLEPIVVLNRNIDLSLIKKYDSGANNSTRQKHQQSRDTKRLKGKSKKLLSSYEQQIELLEGSEKITGNTKLKNRFKKILSKRSQGRAEKLASLPLHCKFCTKTFYKDTHLQYHERMHVGEKPFACNLCGKKFVQKTKLNRHFLIHQQMKELECNECGKRFVSKENLKSHLLSHVKSSFVFKCNQCPKSFTLDSNRKRHELTHIRIGSFKCHICLKIFRTKFELNRHVKIHQKERPFSCHDCGRSFLSKFEVLRHALTHSDQKNYSCKHCQEEFRRLDNYKRHVLHHHPADPLSMELSAESSRPEMNKETSRKEDNILEKKKEKSVVKAKKISRTSSNPEPSPISFVQPLTPQSAPSPYSISHNYELASVIRETLPDLKNAVPVITAPISMQPSSSFMDPIPLEQALVLNSQIEEKIYTQNSFCEFPGLTRKTTVSVVNRRPSLTFTRRDSCGSNSSSNDGTTFMTMNQDRVALQQDHNDETNVVRKDVHVHWRRRTAETLKSKIDQNI